MLKTDLPFVTSAAWNEVGPDYAIAPHVNDLTQWYGVIYGRVEQRLASESLLLGPLQSVLIPPGVVRSPRVPTGTRGRTGYFWVMLRGGDLRLDRLFGKALTAGEGVKSELLLLMDELRRPRGANSEALVRALVSRILIGLERQEGEDFRSDDHGDLVRGIEAFLRSNLHRALTRADLVEFTRLSPAHLARVYRQATGETLHHRLTRLRLERSRELLRHSSQTLTHIAYETGFSSPSHFSFLFRRATGVSPGAFRKGVAPVDPPRLPSPLPDSRPRHPSPEDTGA